MESQNIKVRIQATSNRIFVDMYVYEPQAEKVLQQIRQQFLFYQNRLGYDTDDKLQVTTTLIKDA